MSVSCTAPAAPVALERIPTAPITETPPSRLSDRFYTDPAQHIDRPPPRYTASA
ncbi:MAG TPA: hypothetical protein VK864_18155 [Longimicrobiales bacterium]|nr:hypothetical protein [Longimicrobiales bacterium]